ncbi:hypothetical protein [Stenotrophomonas sp. LMG 10879]|uniref:hypothetical protein n=1 Tax=Stenotrophomonas sp. LMG 10879 TaxID=487706 RepID=UPI0013FD4DC3|nr:hypothetical protein [Stenotrophomonas sp. LMG 10879]
MVDQLLTAAMDQAEPIQSDYSDGPVWNAFGLTRAAYLVVPRRTLQSMPLEWQERLVALMAEAYEPVDTVITRDRLALVTVVIKGTPYVIVDIGLRMLKPHELYRAQGFPAGHIVDRTANGTPLSTSAAVRMVSNSVSPPSLRALAEANLDRESFDMAVAA